MAKDPCPLEIEECTTFAEQLAWWKATGKITLYSHLANECPKAQLGRKVAQGMTSGVPDYILLLPSTKDRKEKVILFVEMKRQSGSKLSPAQIEWITALNMVDNVQACVAYGSKEAISFVNQFIS